MPDFARLAAELEGDLRVDAVSRHIYAVDASLYRVEPQAVVLPKSRDDLLATLAFARDEGLPVTGRGAATGLAGGCLGSGIVVDCSKYLRRILHVDYQAGTATVEAGVVQDQLNAALAPRGYRYGPDTSTGSRATLGGMFGNNSSGAHSLRYGKTVDNLLSCDLLLADGEVLTCEELDYAAWERADFIPGALRRVLPLLTRFKAELTEEIARVFPMIQRRVSGYNLDELLRPGNLNLARIACGSEGTFGITDRLTVNIRRNPKATGLCVVHCRDLLAALDHVPELLPLDPFAVELMDRNIVIAGQQSPALKGQLDWLDGQPDGLLAVEFDGADQGEVQQKMGQLAKQVKGSWAYHTATFDSAAAGNCVWNLRKAGLGLLMGRRTSERALPFLEDLAVPPEQVGRFAREFCTYMEGQGKELGIYGHAGVGLLHFRPMLDLRRDQDVQQLVTMMEDVSDLVKTYGGAVSGEHGDGLVRSWLIPKMFGPKLYGAFQDLKAAFDPEGRMNPGKIVDAPPPSENLRIGPGTPLHTPQTFLDYSAEGGFAFAVEMCNGNAECRQYQKRLMCPSFHATGDERDTTRARATALQAFVHGQRPLSEFTSQDIYDILDLCLECKGCKQECPSQVDMAKLKSEFLHHYQQEHGVKLRSRLFASVHTVNRLGSALAPLSTWLNGLGPARWGRGLMGIAPQRDLPPFRRDTFSKKWRKESQTRPAPAGKLVLMVDTHSEYNYPELGLAAARVLTALGWELVCVPVGACGRPAFSKGLLPQAREEARQAIAALLPHARQGLPLVGLEPSYVSLLQEEALALLPGQETATVARASFGIAAFLAQLPQASLACWDQAFRAEPAADVWLHGHCHQKASTGTEPNRAVLGALPGVTMHEIDSGCCGMAGSFGYEKEHYEFSLAVGETRLFPAIRDLPEGAAIVADGVSCRSQIHDGTGRQALHLVEFLATRLKD